jgi:hypothetical protein
MIEEIQKLNYRKNNFYKDKENVYYPPSKTTSQSVSARYKIIKLESDDLFYKWQTYVENHPDTHIFDHPLWFSALEHEYNRKGCVLASLDNYDNIKGILPLLPTIGLPLKLDSLVTTRRYSSLPRTPLGGLVADDEFVSEALLNEAISRVDSRRGKTFLQLKSYSSDLNKRNSQIQRVPWRSSYVMCLPDDPSKIRFGDKKHHHRVKWAVNKARKLGITVRKATNEEDIKKWYDLYNNTMRWHVVPVRPYRFFKFLWEKLHHKGLMTVLLAEIDNESGKKLLSGSFFLHFNNTFFYSFNGRCQEGLVSHANDLIQWEAIHLAVGFGYSKYDMGEVSSNNSSLEHFKTKRGCCAKPIYHYYYPLDEKMKEREIDISEDVRMRKIIWRKVPLFITMQWGILTNRFL